MVRLSARDPDRPTLCTTQDPPWIGSAATRFPTSPSRRTRPRAPLPQPHLAGTGGLPLPRYDPVAGVSARLPARFQPHPALVAYDCESARIEHRPIPFPRQDPQRDRCPRLALRGTAARLGRLCVVGSAKGGIRCSDDSECRSSSHRSGSRAARNDVAGTAKRCHVVRPPERQRAGAAGATGLLMRAPLLGLRGRQPGPGARSPMSPEVPGTPTCLGPKTVAAGR